MKRIEVCAAILHHEGRILATQRGYGDFKDGWEFPGGKMEPGETPEDCIVREIKEELNVDIVPEELLLTVECDYPAFHLTMHCFWSSIAADEQVELLEHEAAKWLLPSELDAVQWLPADLEVVECLKKRLKPSEASFE
ncbi:(deoxy)nucleoside triphosphate pyrophosphohydrolase [uncultured Sutterella sp.]|uniref:(deoxy)nucleoside triphosphate pyrophosphohydrolase n=1 Tax=uncultured Sutterella sp. TaxID=286133 RepID=UPI002608FAD1|nr:(deoxy)nucleoside triphosphate pyrophosphohydrolase [uncultured Sutterella sp.]